MRRRTWLKMPALRGTLVAGALALLASSCSHDDTFLVALDVTGDKPFAHVELHLVAANQSIEKVFADATFGPDTTFKVGLALPASVGSHVTIIGAALDGDCEIGTGSVDVERMAGEQTTAAQALVIHGVEGCPIFRRGAGPDAAAADGGREDGGADTIVSAGSGGAGGSGTGGSGAGGAGSGGRGAGGQIGIGGAGEGGSRGSGGSGAGGTGAGGAGTGGAGTGGEGAGGAGTGGAGNGTGGAGMGGQGDPIFVESFENGYGQWQNQNDGLDLLFNGTPGAVGTARCGFVETSGASSGERPHHSFSPPVTPTNMEWWARPSSATPGTGNLALSSGTTGNADILEQNFSALAPIRFTATDGTTRINVDSTKARVANAWYHFELRNIDWRGRSYDYYLDGTLQKAGLPLPNVAGISRIDLNGGLFSTSSIVGTCFDEIVFR